MHAVSQLLGSPTPSAWCPEEDTRDNVVARRNVVVEVHLPSLEVRGDGDVVGKITADLHLSGVRVRPTVVRERLKAFHREALQQTNATD